MLAAGKMFGQTNMDTDASREIPLSVVLQAEDKWRYVHPNWTLIRPTQEQVEQIGHGQTEEIIIGCRVHRRVLDDDHTYEHIPQYASYEYATENDGYLENEEQNKLKWSGVNSS